MINNGCLAVNVNRGVIFIGHLAVDGHQPGRGEGFVYILISHVMCDGNMSCNLGPCQITIVNCVQGFNYICIVFIGVFWRERCFDLGC